MNKDKKQVSLAKLLKWSDEQIIQVLVLQKLNNQYNSLPRKDSFSAWELMPKIQAQELVVDKLMDDNMASYKLPTYLSMKQIMHILDGQYEKEDRFLEELSKIMPTGMGGEILDYMQTTDEQRTDALLKALELWE